MTGWNDAVAAYVTAMRAAGRAAGTIRLHRSYLTRLAMLHRWPWRVTGEQLVAFVGREGWAPETRKSARAAVVGFYRWGFLVGHVEEDPSVVLPPVRVPPSLPRPTPEHLVRRLLRDDSRVGFMAALAAYGGLRAGEIARVRGSDLDGTLLRVLGKGGRVREVPLANVALLERIGALGDTWAFPNGHGSHLSPGHVSRLLSRAMPDGWTAHTLRHRMATVAYAGTGDLLAVGQVLGHSRPETTQRYVRLGPDKLLAVARAVDLAG